MPFQSQPHSFDAFTIGTVNEIGGVYGLAKPSVARPGWYTILYVGKTDNLRRRLAEHFNNPPVAGITHFFAEGVNTSWQRTQREEELIAEFNPVGNTLLK